MKREYYNNCEVDELKKLEGAYVTGVEIMEDEENGDTIHIKAIKKYSNRIIPIAFNITRNGCYKMVWS